MDANGARSWREAGLLHVLRPGALIPAPALQDALEPPFRDCLAKARPGVCFALTYFELGDDLSGRSDPGRRELWSGMIKASGVMSGRTTFVPCTRPQGDRLHPDAASFWECLGALRPVHLLVFGLEAATALFPFAEGLGETWHHRNLTVSLFPGPSELGTCASPAAIEAIERIRTLS